MVYYLNRGTRQGCQLSPLLFALAIEPLACRLLSSPDITGFCLRDSEERVSLYADDMLLYLGDTFHCTTDVHYRGIWLMVRPSNWDKSVFMPLDVLPSSFPPESVPLLVVSEFK